MYGNEIVEAICLFENFCIFQMKRLIFYQFIFYIKNRLTCIEAKHLTDIIWIKLGKKRTKYMLGNLWLEIKMIKKPL